MMRASLRDPVQAVRVTRADLSIGTLDLFRFDGYDHAFPRHSHDHFTVGVLGPRNGRIRFRQGTWNAAEGAILAIPPDEPHSAEPLKRSGWTYRTFCPSREIVALALESKDVPVMPVFPEPVIHDPVLARRFLRLHRTLEAGPPTLALEETLLELLRLLVDGHGSSPPASAQSDAAVAVARARAYLHSHYGRQVKLTELATVSGVSPFHLIRSFRALLGITPHAYLTQVRANRARGMLLGGETPSAAACRCGFSDQSHLTRTFKGIFGIPPGSYLTASRTPFRRGA